VGLAVRKEEEGMLGDEEDVGKNMPIILSRDVDALLVFDEKRVVAMVVESSKEEEERRKKEFF
jgi:hypothetical protein